MTNAKKDENGRSTLIGILNTTGNTIVRATAVPSTHALSVVDGTGQSDNGNHGGNALLDQNSVPTLTCLSSDGSGKIINVYFNSSGQVLTKST